MSERPANPLCKAPAPPAAATPVTLEQRFAGLSFEALVALAHPPESDDRWYAVQQSGEIYRFDNDDSVSSRTLVLDLSDAIEYGGEMGLLGLAFHPNFAENGEIFVDYTVYRGRELYTHISRFTSSDGGASFDPGSEELLLEIRQPFENHNGGQLQFGPDGLLYIGMGDGGSAGDPYTHGQNPDSLLGKILRIDVDNPSGDTPYGIPSDNPYVTGGGQPEIFALGIRNPWRFFFDPATGGLWVGDVGQDAMEEVDNVVLGGNYGWNIKEGTSCYRTDTCDVGGLTDPVVEYPHRRGNKSVTGGPVYRGSLLPALAGVPLFADFYTGNIWGVFADAETGAPVMGDIVPETGHLVSSFAQDLQGEVYVLDYYSGIFQLVPAEAAAEDTFPQTLSATGCMDASDPSKPGAGLLPYAPNHPIWSDGAEKERYLALPDGATIDVDDSGDWILPPGSVTVKQFRVGGTLVETRLLVRQEDGAWAGYSYAWRDDGSDADLLPSSLLREVNGQEWYYPSRGECLQCHTEVAGRALGLEDLQLNGDYTYPSGTASNQIATLSHIGMLTTPRDPSALGALPARDSTSATTEEKARAWLHANCAMCHMPGAPGLGNLDLRYTTPLAETGLCEKAPENGDVGVEDALILTPGAPEASVLTLRARALDINRMPPVGSRIVDEEGVALVEDWIRGMSSCP